MPDFPRGNAAYLGTRAWIDTRIPGFAHRDQDGDGVSTLMEWKHVTSPTDRLSRPNRQSLSL